MAIVPSNRMSKLLDKIERRLGTAILNLPDNLSKDNWGKLVIQNETLDTFSRFFPNAITITLTKNMQDKNGYYVMDEALRNDPSVEIIGVKDVNWKDISRSGLANHEASGYGIYSQLPTDYSVNDVLAIQTRIDMTSIFDNNIYIDFVPPNKVKLTTNSGNDATKGMPSFPLTIFVKHANNLMTISPTTMEVFEELAEADVARFLYENLKYYDNVETVFATTDMKISDLQDSANKREDIVNKLDEAHVSFSNKNQPMIFCV